MNKQKTMVVINGVILVGCVESYITIDVENITLW